MLDSELDAINQFLIDNGYPEDVLVSCIKEKLPNISSEIRFGPEKCPVYLKLHLISSKSHQNLETKLIEPLHLVSML